MEAGSVSRFHKQGFCCVGERGNGPIVGGNILKSFYIKDLGVSSQNYYCYLGIMKCPRHVTK